MTRGFCGMQKARDRKDVMPWVRTWSCADVQRWLEAHELDHLKAAFASASIDGKVCYCAVIP